METSVVQSSMEACEEGLCGIVGAADGGVLEVKGRHVQRAVDGFSMSSFFCNGPIEAEGKEQGTQESTSLLLRYSLVRTGRSCRSSGKGHSTWRNQAEFVGPHAGSMTCRSG